MGAYVNFPLKMVTELHVSGNIEWKEIKKSRRLSVYCKKNTKSISMRVNPTILCNRLVNLISEVVNLEVR